ncbi:putative phage tail assembly-like protein [Daldinia childiae]|uniref:putative phage tail assembly-like protein n=1 Tax=Daldinia childiae TaxID=326645 RepID=UPI00144500C0|nr:putative phage tail assembly-like protein [Daldinia childiae]KAF3061567.1 putative phage tail assembly-like protein [Daldinia childiae]
MTSETQLIPYIHLLCMHESASDAFNRVLGEYGINQALINYTIHNTLLSDLPPSLNFDLVVSPANSYGLLDGGFDDAISRAFSPKTEYHALTRVAQKELYRLHSGYLPPGSCCIVKIPESFRGTLKYHDGNGWGCRYLALCPTMRVPSRCDWDRDVVYECIWSLLNAIEQHNRSATEEGSGAGSAKIESILMTPLGTGTGGISDEKWAKQTVLAIKHFIDAKQHPEKWSAIDWRDTGEVDIQLLKTQSPRLLAQYYQR